MPAKPYIPRCTGSISHRGRDWSQRAAGTRHETDQNAAWAYDDASPREVAKAFAIAFPASVAVVLLIFAIGYGFACAFEWLAS